MYDQMMAIINGHLEAEEELPLNYTFDSSASLLYGPLMKFKDMKLTCAEMAEQYEQNPPYCSIKSRKAFYPDCMYYMYTKLFNMAIGIYQKKLGAQGFKLEKAKDEASKCYTKMFSQMTPDKLITMMGFASQSLHNSIINSGADAANQAAKTQMAGEQLNYQLNEPDPLADLELDMDYLKTQMSGHQFDLFCDKYIKQLSGKEICKKYKMKPDTAKYHMKQIKAKLKNYALSC